MCLGLQYYWSPCSEQYLLTTAFTLSLTPGVPTPAVPVSGQCQQEVWLSSRLMYGYQDNLKSGTYGYQSRTLFTNYCVQINNGNYFYHPPWWINHIPWCNITWHQIVFRYINREIGLNKSLAVLPAAILITAHLTVRLSGLWGCNNEGCAVNHVWKCNILNLKTCWRDK